MAPGFIDLHTHAWPAILERPLAENYARQGVTTLVGGPDGSSPLPQGGNADLCVCNENFVLAAARACAARTGQKLARFTAIKPSETEKGHTAYLAEEAEYSDDQARDAAIQRLLNIAGYDVSPIDGIRGAKTDAALLQFIADNKLTPTAAGRPDFFDVLIAAAQQETAV